MMESIESVRDATGAALCGARAVVLLHGVLDDPACAAVLALLAELSAHQHDPARVTTAYAAAFRQLAAIADDEPVGGLADAWQAHLTALVLDNVNPWSAQAERGGSEAVGRGMREQARRDLAALRRLFDLDGVSMWRTAQRLAGDGTSPEYGAWTPWLDLASPSADDSGDAARASLRRRLAESASWPDLAGELESHWSRHGTGMVARYRSLRWEGRATGVIGITHPDPIRLEQLVGYEREQALLRENTERFLAGLPAQNALLYGTPGTGKSSTVKALVNAYAERGLRLLEVRKEDLGDLPAIAALVRGRAPRFVLFVDDLSFEEHETQYKALKALLEGAAEARPDNLIIYATTNRRNLIRENFADRGLPSDDVHGRDTMQEKISLAARFGLRITFAAPDQERYLTIAASIAHQRGIDLPEDELRRRALAWERQHGGRSGRAARQFADDLEAETRGRPACT